MTFPLKAYCLAVAMMASSAVAQTDPHAAHHPAAAPASPPPAATAPATAIPGASGPHCPMMGARAPATGAVQSQGRMSMLGKNMHGKDMMGGATAPDMMKTCMKEKPSSPADHQHEK